MSYWRCQPDMKYIHRHLNEFRKFKFQSGDNSSDQKILTLSDMNFQFSMKKIVECTNKFVTSYCSDDAIWNCCSRTTLSSYGLEI